MVAPSPCFLAFRPALFARAILDARGSAALAHHEFHHIISSSHMRLKKPPSSTALSATSGRSAITLPSSVTFTLPIFWPFAIGATSVLGMSMLGLSCAYLPRGVLTSIGESTPSCTSSASPFHTFCLEIALFASYRR